MFTCIICKMQFRVNFCNNVNCAFFGMSQEQIASMQQKQHMHSTEHSHTMHNMSVEQLHGGQTNMHTKQCKVASEYPRPVIPCNNQLQISFATVPMQNNADTYSLKTALIQGTLFEVLDMPYNKKIINRSYR